LIEAETAKTKIIRKGCNTNIDSISTTLQNEAETAKRQRLYAK